ncbi:hypothetical protein [Candidatus Methylacidithermus pantelleriae]|uniref:hypothetical protein n=1 Tax=Candidatus Methylacidithermus pantelleriae TaxID=2744239 RepID=UPI001BD4908E|nr:hypothetical protein [Candidatus Methylacidithermus pantelleriae]
MRGDQEPQVIRFPQSPLQRVLQEEGYRVAQSEEGPNGEVLEEEGEDQEPF